MKKINLILEEILEEISPSKKELKEIEKTSKDFVKEFNSFLKKEKINASVFIGGSLAKNTMIKKQKYDVDIFVRFDEKYKNSEISGILERNLKEAKINFEKIHGSRDYFRIKVNECFYLELIPVKKNKNPEEAENITDLSYSHVKYVNKKITKNLVEEIRIAKAFCYANKCYGAESYINGFSGYALELLILHYKSFINFIKSVSKIKDNEKIIIDIEKQYKNKKQTLIDLNSSKLQSPIILIDPTFKQRNAAAAISKETFERFKKISNEFIKNPSKEFFELKRINFEKEKIKAERRKIEFLIVGLKTNKQKGDIAGSKLKKFYDHLAKEIQKFFNIKERGFEYYGEKSSKGFFSLESKREILIKGPFIYQKENVKAFKKKHKNTFVRDKIIYSRKKVNFSAKDFLLNWIKENKTKINEMSISDIFLD